MVGLFKFVRSVQTNNGEQSCIIMERLDVTERLEFDHGVVRIFHDMPFDQENPSNSQI